MSKFKPTILVLVSTAISIYIVLILQNLFNGWAVPMGIAQYSFLSFMVLSAIEIILITLATFVTLKIMKEDRNPSLVLIYIISAAFVFSMIENAAAIVNATDLKLQILFIRLMGATPLQIIRSGTVGLYWKQSIMMNNVGYLYHGLFIATLFGAIFNYLIIRFEPITIPTIFILGMLIFFLYKKKEIG